MQVSEQIVNENKVVNVYLSKEEFAIFHKGNDRHRYKGRIVRLLSSKMLIATMLVPLAGCSVTDELYVTPSTSSIYVNVNKNGEVKNIELEDYVIGVVAAEMPASFELEALKSQAVAARTYALKRVLAGKTLESTTFNQVFYTEEEMRVLWGSDYSHYYNRIKNAVLETKDIVITHNGVIIDALYHSSNSGYTENSEDYYVDAIPYLRSVESSYDFEMNNIDEVILSTNSFKEALGITDEYLIISNINLRDSKYVSSVIINEEEFSGIRLRSVFSLKSHSFTITTMGEDIVITTKGYGHGVGMSQYGARGLAKEGKSYEQILKHYYTDVELQNVEENVLYG